MLLDVVCPIIILFSIDLCLQYLRKYLSSDFNEHDFIILTTIFSLVMICAFYSIKMLFVGNTLDISSSIKKWFSSTSDYRVVLLSLTMFSLLYTFIVFRSDKIELMDNNMKILLILKSIAMIALVIFNCFIAGTKINIIQIIGLIVLTIGLFLIGHEHANIKK